MDRNVINMTSLLGCVGSLLGPIFHWNMWQCLRCSSARRFPMLQNSLISCIPMWSSGMGLFTRSRLQPRGTKCVEVVRHETELLFVRNWCRVSTVLAVPSTATTVTPPKGKKISQLDLSQAYLELQVDDASMPYVTVNTHQGLYSFTRLPFGVASAPISLRSEIYFTHKPSTIDNHFKSKQWHTITSSSSIIKFGSVAFSEWLWHTQCKFQAF